MAAERPAALQQSSRTVQVQLREKANLQYCELTLFAPSDEPSNNVVSKFLRKDAKNVADAPRGVYEALQFLRITPQGDLMRTGRLERVQGEVHEFKWHLKDHWLRLFVAYYPNGVRCVVLHVIFKKSNKIPEPDKDLAMRNFRAYQKQLAHKREK